MSLQEQDYIELRGSPEREALDSQDLDLGIPERLMLEDRANYFAFRYTVILLSLYIFVIYILVFFTHFLFFISLSKYKDLVVFIFHILVIFTYLICFFFLHLYISYRNIFLVGQAG